MQLGALLRIARKMITRQRLGPAGAEFALRLFVFLVDVLGAAVLFALIAAAAWYIYKLQVRG